MDTRDLIARPKRRRRARWKAFKGVLIGAPIGVGLGLLASVTVPTAVISASVPVAGGAWFSYSRRNGRSLDDGDFAHYEARLRRRLEKPSKPYRRAWNSLLLGDLLMRQNRHAEAIEVFEGVEEATGASVYRYAEVNSAACKSLIGRPYEVTLKKHPEAGLYLLYKLLHARIGNVEQALGIRPPAQLISKLIFGRRHFAYEYRMSAVLDCALLGNASSITDAQRKRMIAGYPGEFEYVAAHWPEVREVVAALDLYQGEVSSARLLR